MGFLAVFVSYSTRNFDARWILIYIIVILISNGLRYLIKIKTELVTLETAIDLRSFIFQSKIIQRTHEDKIHYMVNEANKLAEYYSVTLMKLLMIVFSTILGLCYCFIEATTLTWTLLSL